MVLDHPSELQAFPDKLQIKHFTQSLSRAPGVGRNVPTSDQWNEMSPCTQLDDTSDFSICNMLYSERSVSNFSVSP